MNQPLGCAIGNNLEIKEVIDTLKGNGPKDITEICISSGAILLNQAKIFSSINEAREAIKESVKEGKAFKKFVEFVKSQGGDVSYILDPSKFPVAKNIIKVYSLNEGYVHSINALEIGKSSMHLGGGRETLDDVIDMSAGIVLNKKVGDKVYKNELLATLYTNKSEYETIKENVLSSFVIKKERVKEENSLTHEIIE